MENRAKFAEVIARPAYINCPPSTILEPPGQVRVRRRTRRAGPELHDLFEPELQLPNRVRQVVATQFRRWAW